MNFNSTTWLVSILRVFSLPSVKSGQENWWEKCFSRLIFSPSIIRANVAKCCTIDSLKIKVLKIYKNKTKLKKMWSQLKIARQSNYVKCWHVDCCIVFAGNYGFDD